MSEPRSLEMSVILVTPDCLETIRKTLKHLGAQSAKDRLEIVIVSPAGAQFDLGDPDLGGFADVQVVRLPDMRSTAAARTAGIRHARAPIVVFTEDHSFSDAGWAAALINAHQRPWAAVGPTVGNANPVSAISWANFLIEYGEWLDASPDQVTQHLPGHNSSYKRQILLDYGEKLEAMIQAESVLHWDLRARGHEIAIEQKARTKHLNFSRLAPSMQMRFWSGRMFAAARSREWSFWRRLLYAGGGPLIPFVRARRVLRQMRRRRWERVFVLRVLPFLLFLLVCDVGGEIAGYVFGQGDAEGRVANFEFRRQRYLSREDGARLNRGELPPA